MKLKLFPTDLILPTTCAILIYEKEGDFLYHRASKLCKNERRVILSCQFVTNNEMTFLNKLRIKLKDFAYTGNIQI